MGYNILSYGKISQSVNNVGFLTDLKSKANYIQHKRLRRQIHIKLSAYIQ